MTDVSIQNSVQNPPAKFSCKICAFNTSRQALFNTHLLTAKHKRLTLDDQTFARPSQKQSTHVCRCGKSYKFKQSLYKHKKTCLQHGDNFKNTTVMELLKQNEMLMEVLKDQNNKLIELSK
jgi:hypothetical protein